MSSKDESSKKKEPHKAPCNEYAEEIMEDFWKDYDYIINSFVSVLADQARTSAFNFAKINSKLRDEDDIAASVNVQKY